MIPVSCSLQEHSFLGPVREDKATPAVPCGSMKFWEPLFSYVLQDLSLRCEPTAGSGFPAWRYSQQRERQPCFPWKAGKCKDAGTVQLRGWKEKYQAAFAQPVSLSPRSLEQVTDMALAQVAILQTEPQCQQDARSILSHAVNTFLWHFLAGFSLP